MKLKKKVISLATYNKIQETARGVFLIWYLGYLSGSQS